MTKISIQQPEKLPCLAIPGAARRGWRTDLLCASVANTDVGFDDRRVPVCRMHEATYTRWGADAEGKAVELWGWVRASADDA